MSSFKYQRADKDVIESMLYLLRPERAGKNNRSIDEAANLLSYALMQQWEYCTVYTVNIKYIKKRVIKLYNDFQNNIHTRKNRRNDNWKLKMVKYNEKMRCHCDIYCTNDDARKTREEEVGVEMGEDEYWFLEDMCTERKQFCDDFVDRQWQKEKDMEEKRSLLLRKRSESQKEASQKDTERIRWVPYFEVRIDVVLSVTVCKLFIVWDHIIEQ